MNLFTAFHHHQGRRQGATAIIEFFSVTHTSKNFEGARGRLCSSKGGACATAQWHNGQSKPEQSETDVTAAMPHCCKIPLRYIKNISGFSASKFKVGITLVLMDL